MSNVVNFSDYQTKEVVIDGITIKQDKDGLFCLNDVHKASGGHPRHTPVRWKDNASTQELLEKLETENSVPKVLYVRKGYGVTGTYAVKELVYAYAMWISAEYHLKVIRAYNRLATEGVAVHENAAQDLLNNPLKYIQALIEQAQKLLKQKTRQELDQHMDDRDPTAA
ncbi:KilA-N domain-containing protein [Pseudomonas sp. Pseu.R1]|uniref:KilA-N domain-containing protein n=1 Tax=Pseudomonas sp. Pseu.R1 TaxID=3379818 RepID=UPI003B924687